MLQSLRSTDCRLLQGADAKPTVKFLYPRFLFLFLFFQITFGKKRVGQPNTTQPKWSSAGALLTACAPLSLESSRTLVRCFGGGGRVLLLPTAPPAFQQHSGCWWSPARVGAWGSPGTAELAGAGAVLGHGQLLLGIAFCAGVRAWALQGSGD